MLEAILAIVIGFPTSELETTTKQDVTFYTSNSEMNEDDPGWDCRTMGNHKCGVYNEITGEWTVVEWFTI